MKRAAYEIRKNHDGYAVFELTLANNTVVSELKLHEYDILVVSLHKLAQHLQFTCPNMLPEKPSKPDVKEEALPANSDEKEVGNPL